MAIDIDCDSICILTSFAKYISEGYSPGEVSMLQKLSSCEVFIKASAFLFVLKTLCSIIVRKMRKAIDLEADLPSSKGC